MGRLEQICTPQELEAVLSIIPLTQSNCRDKLIWNYNRNGKFSVKTAYWLASKDRRTSPLVVEEHWKHLWKLKIPPKMFISYGGV